MIIPICISAFGIAGCQRIPDQRQVTKLDLFDIVQNVRCEFRKVLLEGYPAGNWIYETGIAYEFTFTTTINNNGDLGFTGFWPFTRKRGFGHVDGIINADYDKTRQGETVATITELASNLVPLDCGNARYSRSRRYPVKGEVGIADVVREFYNTSSIPGLASVSNFTRTLTFTVKKTGSINPAYFLSPVSPRRRTFDTSLTFLRDRQDVHKVLLTLDPPEVWKIAGRPPPEPEEAPVQKVQIVGGDGKHSQIQIVTDKDPADGAKGIADGRTSLPTYEPPPRKREPRTEGLSPDRIRKLERNIDRQENVERERGLDRLLGR